MTLYQKVLNVYGMIRDSIGKRTLKTDVAPEFSDSASYVAGRLVYHDNRLYKCVSDHSGPWVAGHFATTTLDGALASIKQGGGTPFMDNLYLKDGSGNFHKVEVESSGGIFTLAVDQSVSEPSGGQT